MRSLSLYLFFTLMLATTSATLADSSALAIMSLRCQYLDEPLGIDAATPGLSWVISGEHRGLRQAAYRILVSSSREKLNAGNADLWDSGKIASNQTIQVHYAGKRLAARDQCFWKVGAWTDPDAEPAWSNAAHWSMGPMNRADWGDAHWIGAPAEKPRPYSEWTTKFGYLSAYAMSADVAKWVTVDLKESREVNQVRMYGVMVPGEANLYFPLRFRLDVSDDANFAHFKTVADATKEDFTPDPKKQKEWSAEFEPTKARYVRLFVTKLRKHPHNPQFGFAVSELQVLTDGKVISEHAPVLAADLTPSPGWSLENLTDGMIDCRMPRTDWAIPPSPLLRKAFGIDSAIAHAEVSVTGVGEYDLRLNGQRVGDHQLAPEWTNYRQSIQYQTFDVTSLVKQGENVFGATLGDGWYAGRLAGTRWSSEFPQRGVYGVDRRLLLRLDVTLADGSTRSIFSDGGWKIDLDGPIRSADHFLGETYDARLDQPGWDAPGFVEPTGSHWQPITVDDSIKAQLPAQMNEPIRITQTFPAVAMTEPKPGVYVFALPQNIAGWARVTLDGPAGTAVTVRHAERLNADGTLFTMPLGGAPSVDRYILDGKGRRSFEPHFTYHGFQYVEVTGLKYKPQLADVQGRVVTSDLPAAGNFECSDTLLNRIWSMALWSQRGNQMSVPTDCPSRNERYGYGGDALSFSDTAMFNMDMAAFYAKWSRDWREAAFDDGTMPPFAPNPRFEGVPDQQAVMGWCDAAVQIPWKSYQRYGDVDLLARNYESMRRYVDTVAARSKDGIWNVGTCGDWLSQAMIKGVPGYPCEGGYTGLPNDLFGTAFAYASTRDVARAAAVLGHADDASRYGALAEKIRESFNRHFVKPDGTVAGNCQSAYVMALYFDLIPENLRPAAARKLIEQIDRYDGRLSTGIMATPKILNVLSRNGHTDVAYRLIQSRRFPSLGFMLDQGATTVWERWDNYLPERGYHKDDMQSYNHDALGGQAVWLYSTVLGIQPDDASLGFDHFFIRPEPGGGLTWAAGEYHSVHGTIVVSWKIDGHTIHLDFTVPQNTTATVIIPTTDPASITESGAEITRAPGVTRLTDPAGATFLLAGGKYSFKASI